MTLNGGSRAIGFRRQAENRQATASQKNKCRRREPKMSDN
jgi:hypothetical protein